MSATAVVIVIAALIILIAILGRQGTSDAAKYNSNVRNRKKYNPSTSGAKMSFYRESVVGITKRNNDGSSRQVAIKRMREGQRVNLQRDPLNKYDSNAIEVYSKGGDMIGFISALRAQELAPQMDKGYMVDAHVDEIFELGDGPREGVRLGIQRYSR